MVNYINIIWKAMLPSMRPSVWISSIKFSDGTVLKFNKGDAVVFVGPNNAGKSASLKETATSIRYNSYDGNVIRHVRLVKRGTVNDVINFLNSNAVILKEPGPYIYYKGYNFEIHVDDIKRSWNETNCIKNLFGIFVNELGTEERLKSANPASNIRITQKPPTHPIHYLQKDDSKEQQIGNFFKAAFGEDLVIHRNAGDEVPLYVGTRPTVKDNEDRVSLTYIQRLEETLSPLQNQGDGMRSFVGVLLNVFTSEFSMLFIDEPEAFLHPPQAKLLGEMLAKNLSDQMQMFLATHSEDFLKGLLDANSKSLKIIRIQRDDKINRVRMLDNKDIKKLWNDPLLRYSNILSGLFHSQVVICEGDADCRFYSAILSAVCKDNHDLLFISSNGKHRIPVVMTSLINLDVKIKTIIDFDILNTKRTLQQIYEYAGGNWREIKSDWKLVKDTIDAKRPELETNELKYEICSILESVKERIFPQDKITEINKCLKKASAWSNAKNVGQSFIPNGDPTQAFSRLNDALKKKGIHIVTVGELERFVKSVGNHGPKWVNEVLETKDLKNDPDLEEARAFILKVVEQ